MRAIRFRGKSGNGEWAYGYYAQERNYVGPNEFEYVDCIIKSEKGAAEGMWFEVDPKTVGQFTGLLDKCLCNLSLSQLRKSCPGGAGGWG